VPSGNNVTNWAEKKDENETRWKFLRNKQKSLRLGKNWRSSRKQSSDLKPIWKVGDLQQICKIRSQSNDREFQRHEQPSAFWKQKYLIMLSKMLLQRWRCNFAVEIKRNEMIEMVMWWLFCRNQTKRNDWQSETVEA
jgi:hypothetical protein